jgi:hypothetical protein
MKFVRTKVITECIGIRRSMVNIKPFEESLNFKDNPLNLANGSIIKDGTIIFNDTIKRYELNSEIFYHIQKSVESLGEKQTLDAYISFTVLEFNEEMIKSYEDNILKGYWYDEYPGEFEYLLALHYKYDLSDELKYEIYKEKSEELKFKISE